MLEKNIRELIIELIHQQVVPAVGCTEPMAVALCTARATELLGQRPEHISVLLSANILKNAMGVNSRSQEPQTGAKHMSTATSRLPQRPSEVSILDVTQRGIRSTR